MTPDKPLEPFNPDLPLAATPDAASAELAPLLSEPFARVWQLHAEPGSFAQLRAKLHKRVAASLAEQAPFTTVRGQVAGALQAPGVVVQSLYRSAAAQPQRAGEPQRVRLVTLSAGAKLTADILGISDQVQVECLVMSGGVRCTGSAQTLSQRDYHVCPAGHSWPHWHSAHGAVLFVREAVVVPQDNDTPHVVWDQVAGWPDYAPGIQRRVLWQRAGQAALLYWAQPGAQVPEHRHGHDEECFMVQGELFLDDLLMQAGDYQLAPAGTGHRITETDTGAVLYAHGDTSLLFVG
jgi:ChrR Cupin-like domain